MVAEPLTSGLVGWLVAAVGTTMSRRVSNAVLGSSAERELRKALSASVSDVITLLSEPARDDLSAALRERGDVLPFHQLDGEGPYAMLSSAVRQLVAPLALPGQTLDIHGIDPEWLTESLVQALNVAIRRGAVSSSSLLGLAQLLGIERLELAQSRMEALLSATTREASVNTLPRTVADFAGREDVVEQLCAVSENQIDPSVTVFSVEGMAGIGKTEVALRAAHRLQGRYPGFQVYIDLQGFTPGLSPLSSTTALESLLITIGVPPSGVPTGLDQRASLWRARLSAKRALIVLDNASSEEQVRPLLPGSGSSVVIITSRRSMSALDDIHLIPLDVLDDRSAIDLFICIAGPVAREDPDAVASVVRLCGGLPLAIRLVAGRISRRPATNIRELVGELTDAGNRLAGLRDGNREVGLAFDVSYGALTPALRAAYRRLGLHPGPDITTEALAALANCTRAVAVTYVDELLSQSLLQELPGNRLVLHDLLRAHARGRADAEESVEACADAQGRLLQMHVREANRVNEDLSRSLELPERLATSRWAQHWLATERANLVACAKLSAERGDEVAVDLAGSIAPHLITLGYIDDAEAIYVAAETVGRQTGDRAGQVRGLLGLGQVERFTARYGSARGHFTAARTLCAELGDGPGLGDALYGLGEIERVTGDYRGARRYYELSRDVCVRIGDRRREANGLRGMGEVAQAVGDVETARDNYLSAHTLSAGAGDRQGQAFALLGLGEAERGAGRFAEAKVHYEAARTLCIDAVDRRGQANAAFGLGEVARAISDYQQAQLRYHEAYELSVALGNRRGQTHVLLGLGATFFVENRLAASRRAYSDAAALGREIGDRRAEGRALLALGDVAEREGDSDAAISAWNDALVAFTAAGAADHAGQASRRLDASR